MQGIERELEIYLKPTEFINSDSSKVIEFAKSASGGKVSSVEIAVALYYAVRDGIRYNPYKMDLSRNGFKADTTLERRYAFCVPKAILLAAAARVMGIPSRLGFADVKNHLTSKRLYEVMKSDVFVYHGYTEMYLEGKWVKATPAFNRALCKIIGVKALEFDGRNDALFQQFDLKGNRYMEYVIYHGTFTDLPYTDFVNAFLKAYPSVAEKEDNGIEGNFDNEAEPGFGHPLN